ncbi:MAG: cytochrome C, partial [Sideroxydans sp.]|nr:cytochrome C [Sideroxydans sp.]
PKEDALSCAQCHNKNGRLKDIQGVYMPARDGKHWLDVIGWSLALLTLIGVLVHGAIRIYSSKKEG